MTALDDWLASNTVKLGDCHIWQKGLQKNSGQPKTKIGRKTVSGLRKAIYLDTGVLVPPDKWVLPSCGHYKCVNPQHSKILDNPSYKALPQKPDSRDDYQLLIRSNVDISLNGCWHWKGDTKNGYGRVEYKSIRLAAHRLSYMAFNDDFNIKSEDFICHKCDNPLCVNPDHLYKGSAKTNMQDAIKRGRGPTGVRKLSFDKVKQMKEDIYNLGMSNRKIASLYGVSEATVRGIKNGKLWPNVPFPV